MTIAFLIIAHNDAMHVERLVSSLAPHKCFIHLDLKTEFDDGWKNITATFVKERHAVYWGGYSQVKATVSLIQCALAAKETYDRIVLLSGACYPIRPLGELEELFRRDPALNYVQYVKVRGSGHLPTQIERWHFRDGILPWRWTARYRAALIFEKIIRKLMYLSMRPFSRSWPSSKVPYLGSQWWAMSPDCAAYVLEQLRQDPKLPKFYKNSLASDEQIIQSIVANSNFPKTGEVLFGPDGVAGTANLHLIHPSLAKWYTAADLDEVFNSGKYFVRKVSTNKSRALLDAIDERIRTVR